MSKFSMSAKTIAGTVTVLLFLSLTGVVVMNEKNKSLAVDMNNEKLKSERILSEKLLLDKEIAKLKESINSLKGQNGNLDKLLASTSAKVEAKEAELKKMKKENTSLKQYQQQNAELQKIRETLEKQVASLSSSLQSIGLEKDALNRTIADLQLKNKSLNEELTKMHIASLDDIRIEALRKNKLTVSAKKTKKLEMNFVVPANKFTDNLQFRIVDPKGTQLSANEGTMTYTTLEGNPVYTASISDDNFYLSESKQIKLEYVPTKKLKAGIYKIEILNTDNTYLGSLQVKLR